MRTLSHYLASEGAMTMTALGVAIGVSKSRLSQLRDAVDWPPELALQVERETEGWLSASDLSPVIADARRSRPAQADQQVAA